jgi:transcriptional regulator
MYGTGHQPFAARGDADLLRLVDAYPLAWVVSAGGSCATPLPLLADTDDTGRIVSLTGHLSAANPQVAALRADGRATALFSGPQAYISPGLVSQARWAPTWNYAIATFEVSVELRSDEGSEALQRLVARMERNQTQPWTVETMGERYMQMIPRIIAFRAHVRSVRSMFKLGQDESRATFEEIVAGVGDPALACWMRDFNSDRC